jgi:hypothetical protein
MGQAVDVVEGRIALTGSPVYLEGVE